MKESKLGRCSDMSKHTKTADQMALEILMSQPAAKKQAQLSRLYAEVTAVRANRVSCPECGSKGPHEDNGCRGADLAFCCKDCGSHFDAEMV